MRPAATHTMSTSFFKTVTQQLESIGRMALLFVDAVIAVFRPPFRYSELLRQLDFVGFQSLVLIVFTGMFTGMVSALQGYNAMHKFGAESMVGAGVALSLTRELGPVISALMIVARVGSSITAELGSMRNSQQIDALSSMAVDPTHYLVAPRMAATTLTLPLLALIFSFAGMVGAYFVAIYTLNMDAGLFTAGVKYWVTLQDITQGMFKAMIFGVIISLVACYQGFYAAGGARGVGEATTKSVVISSVMILLSDYVMTAVMFHGS